MCFQFQKVNIHTYIHKNILTYIHTYGSKILSWPSHCPTESKTHESESSYFQFTASPAATNVFVITLQINPRDAFCHFICRSFILFPETRRQKELGLERIESAFLLRFGQQGGTYQVLWEICWHRLALAQGSNPNTRPLWLQRDLRHIRHV